MSLLPESASFEERVVDCFLALRGRGLDLSALDRPVLEAWASAGVPFEVVARGLRLAAEKALHDAVPGEPLLRSLRGCRRTVDAEIRRHLRMSAGAREGVPASAPSENSWELQRHRELVGEVEAWGRVHSRLAGRRLARVLARLGDGGGGVDLSRSEDVVALGVLGALPFQERGALWRRAQAGGDLMGSAGARRLARRTRLLSALRAALA